MVTPGGSTLFGMMGAAALGACQSSAAAAPAVLETADARTIAELKSVLARAMNDASVDIGPGDLTQTSTISALPPRLNPIEDRSLAAPTQFDLMIRGGDCFLVRRDTNEEFALNGVACKPAGGT